MVVLSLLHTGCGKAYTHGSLCLPAHVFFSPFDVSWDAGTAHKDAVPNLVLVWVHGFECTHTDVCICAATVFQLTSLGLPVRRCREHLCIPMQ